LPRSWRTVGANTPPAQGLGMFRNFCITGVVQPILCPASVPQPAAVSLA
jgi:hypothetical protein